ncbi:MAG: flagellar motor switch protein FliG [Verrucomicrobiota bacterium]|nr:flagellar motor switch protein FliG [Verrucomicrobiota bacterium]
MAASAEANVPSDVSKMNKVQKLAALLVILGPESASKVLKSMDENEIESVSAEMAKLAMISQEMQMEILKEFTEVAVQASSSLRGGIEYTQTVLEKSLGMFKASTVISRVAPARAPVAAMQQILDLDAREIFNLIKNEQPQAIALLISYMPSSKAGEVFSMIRGDQREHVMERLATLSSTPIEVVEKVVEVINQKLGAKHTRALNQTGGIKSAADLLNTLDKNLSKSLLMSLEEKNPELGQAIRQKMFTFEDLTMLEPSSLQKILREVDMRDLAVALKTASEQLKGNLLGCISKRAAETVAEEMSFLGPLKLRDIEAAQMRIIEVVRRLESEGEIELGASNEAQEEEALA